MSTGHALEDKLKIFENACTGPRQIMDCEIPMTLIDYIVVFVYLLGMIAIRSDCNAGKLKVRKTILWGGVVLANCCKHLPPSVLALVHTNDSGRTHRLDKWVKWSLVSLMWLFVTPVYWITAVWYRRMRHLTLGDWFVERYESKSPRCSVCGICDHFLHVLFVDDVIGNRQIRCSAFGV